MILFVLCSLTCVSAATTLPMVFLSPGDAADADGIALEPVVPEPGMTLIPADPAIPKLWYAPVAAYPENGSILLWYQRVNSAEPDYSDQRTLCLGELRDGIWTMPALGDAPAPWGGPNNVCMRRSPFQPTWGGFNVFQIARENGAFRMLYWDQPAAEGLAGAMLASSADGRTWAKDDGGAVFTEHNDAFTLIQQGGEYLLYQTMLEDWPDKPYPDNLDKKKRVQTLRTSKDLRTWSGQELLLRPDDKDAPETEFYLMKAFPYGGRFLGLLMKYYGDPNLPNRHSAILKNELLVSADARHWERPHRETDLGFWSYADPFMQQGKLHFAIWKDGGMETVAYSPNRLVAVHAPQEGAFTTPAFSWPARGVALDADALHGRIDAELLTAEGRPEEKARPVRIEHVEGTHLALDWFGGREAIGAGAPCRVRFRLRNARVFALIEDAG